MLKNVSFSNNNLSLFSFFRSTFDQAHFISNTIQSETSGFFRLRKRHNVLLDEVLFRRWKNLTSIQKEKFKKEFHIEHLDRFEEIAGLYRRMKTALDNSKDYNEAGRFYYNEIEMKRLALRDRIKKKGFFRSIYERIQYRMVGFYKFFTGYGELPFRSFIWFIFFGVLVFPLLHLLNGLRLQSDSLNIIKYPLNEIFSKAILHAEFWQNYVYSIMFSLYHIFPVDFFPFTNSLLKPTGPYDIILSFLNSVVLILLVLFTGIGLKRHFRRF
jgi:hypothetical protein